MHQSLGRKKTFSRCCRRVAKPPTPITGVWVHELDTGHTDTTWVVNITMQSVTESNPGEVYMNVSDDNTFTITYNAAMVSYGTWEETANNNYEFWYHDPDEILMALSVDYQISSNNLVQGLGLNSIYCTKQ